MKHRFLHLSDIHFGQEKGGTLVKHDHVRSALIADVKQLATDRGPATRIIITGDISYSGKQGEYKTATDCRSRSHRKDFSFNLVKRCFTNSWKSSSGIKGKTRAASRRLGILCALVAGQAPPRARLLNGFTSLLTWNGREIVDFTLMAVTKVTAFSTQLEIRSNPLHPRVRCIITKCR